MFHTAQSFSKPLATMMMAGVVAFLSSPAFADEAAEAFVSTVLAEAEPILDSDNEAELYDGLAGLVDKHVDMRRVGLFTLGQYARQMTSEQKEIYLPLFKDYATQIYQNALSEYSGERLEVTGSIDRSERDIIVNSRVADAPPGSDYADLKVHWRVYRDREGEMSIFDAGANDIWLAIEQRSQFTSIIANNGGGEAGINALINELREKTSN